MEQTAVEWLFEQVKSQKYIEDVDFEQAKEMEKQQIIDACIYYMNTDGIENEKELAEQYHNEIFKQD